MVLGYVGRALGGAAGAVVGGVAGTATALDPVGGARDGARTGVQLGGACGGAVAALNVTAATTGRTVLVAGGHAVTRFVEKSHNGVFEEANPGSFAKICALCAADVYNVRTHGRPKTGSFIVDDQNVRVECVSGDQDTNLRVACYRIDSSDLVVAFRGTEVNHMGDIACDLAIAMGCLKSCLNYIEGLGWAESLKQQFDCDRIFVTGHSLGGAMAIAFASDEKNYYNINGCHVFNPGCGAVQNDLDTSTLTGTLGAMGLRIPYILSSDQKIIAHHIYGDPISMLNNSSSTTVVHTYSCDRVCGPHTIDNFTTTEMKLKIGNRDFS